MKILVICAIFCAISLSEALRARGHRCSGPCSPGYGVAEQCRCERCPTGTWTPNNYHREPCRPCSTCGSDLFVEFECSVTHDTKCDWCRSQKAVKTKDYFRKCTVEPDADDATDDVTNVIKHSHRDTPSDKKFPSRESSFERKPDLEGFKNGEQDDLSWKDHHPIIKHFDRNIKLNPETKPFRSKAGSRKYRPSYKTNPEITSYDNWKHDEQSLKDLHRRVQKADGRVEEHLLVKASNPLKEADSASSEDSNENDDMKFPPRSHEYGKSRLFNHRRRLYILFGVCIVVILMSVLFMGCMIKEFCCVPRQRTLRLGQYRQLTDNLTDVDQSIINECARRVPEKTGRVNLVETSRDGLYVRVNPFDHMLEPEMEGVHNRNAMA